jgi:hypothetical protein
MTWACPSVVPSDQYPLDQSAQTLQQSIRRYTVFVTLTPQREKLLENVTVVQVAGNPSSELSLTLSLTHTHTHTKLCSPTSLVLIYVTMSPTHVHVIYILWLPFSFSKPTFLHVSSLPPVYYTSSPSHISTTGHSNMICRGKLMNPRTMPSSGTFRHFVHRTMQSSGTFRHFVHRTMQSSGTFRHFVHRPSRFKQAAAKSVSCENATHFNTKCNLNLN